MNVKELIEKIEALPAEDYKYRPYIDKKVVLALVRQLDEPEKIKVSEEEAEFLETFDFSCEIDVTKALYYVSRTGWGYYLKDNNDIEFKGLTEGFREFKNRKRLIKAILDGYEVEEEKRYSVKIKGKIEENLLVYGLGINRYFFARTYGSSKRNEHTRKQLEEADFGWVFDCEGIEIEEVEE